jgi:hypothetical protein
VHSTDPQYTRARDFALATNMTKSLVSDSERHPILILRALQKQYGNSLIVTLSRYAYVPQSKNDYRRTFQLPISEIKDQRLNHWFRLLTRGRDIALHSKVLWQKRIFHIPMIDFIGRPEINELDALRKFAFVPRKVMRSLYLFDSGRSFHGYSTTLLSGSEWRDFMAGLLLANLPNTPPIIDWRWIGHRLRSDFASLRWSCNSEYYTQLPTLIGRYETHKKTHVWRPTSQI